MSSNNTTVLPNNKINRIEKWDLARAILIFLVVLGHMVDHYTTDSSTMRSLFLFIYTFHMPCFLFLDGLFSKRTIDERRYNHIFSYLVLYLFVQILNMTVRGIITHNISFSLLESDGTHWYGLSLFSFCMITIFLKRFSKKWVLISSIVLSCFVGYDSNVGDYLVLSRTIVFYPFFFAGYCLDPNEVAGKLSSIWSKIVGTLVLITFAIICINYGENIYFVRGLLTGRNSYQVFASVYGKNNLVFYGGLLRLAYYFVVSIILLSILAIVPKHLPKANWIANIGRHSLQIYILHIEILYILYNLLHFKEFSAENGISNLIIIPIAFLITLFLSLNIWEKPIRTIIYPSLCKDEHDG